MSVTHHELARQNFLQSGNAASPEWRVTMLFYAAVHATNHVLYPGAFAPATATHIERAGSIVRHPKLRGIDSDYRQLTALSKISRYIPQNHPMPIAKVNFARALAARVLSIAGISTAAPSQPPNTAAPTAPNVPSQ